MVSSTAAMYHRRPHRDATAATNDQSATMRLERKMDGSGHFPAEERHTATKDTFVDTNEQSELGTFYNASYEVVVGGSG
jgi:hypothetical protein